MSSTSDTEFLIRRARPNETATIAWHRARMFQDMGEISDEIFDDFLEASRQWANRVVAAREYVGWFAAPKVEPEQLIAGAGVQLRWVGPHPCRPAKEGAFAKGRHAIVLNVFTEPEWRRRGLARLLMEEIVRWARAERLDRLVLHASADARSLYERMGFIPTNEMRYEGKLEEP